jgi:hypothetical protein
MEEKQLTLKKKKKERKKYLVVRIGAVEVKL